MIRNLQYKVIIRESVGKYRVMELEPDVSIEMADFEFSSIERVGYGLNNLYTNGTFEVLVYDLDLMHRGGSNLGMELPQAIRDYKMNQIFK